MPFNSETLVTGKLFEDIKEAVENLADPSQIQEFVSHAYYDYAGGKDLGVFGTASNVYFGRETDGTLEEGYFGIDTVRVLEGSIWNPEPSVQALSYRLLHTYKDEEWASSVINSVDLDEDTVQWALSAFEVADVHKDAYGNLLETGDTVVLTQNLNVKGTNFTATKRTIVKRIRLVPDNTEQIEGKVNDQTIVILTRYVKRGG